MSDLLGWERKTKGHNFSIGLLNNELKWALKFTNYSICSKSNAKEIEQPIISLKGSPFRVLGRLQFLGKPIERFEVSISDAKSLKMDVSDVNSNPKIVQDLFGKSSADGFKRIQIIASGFGSSIPIAVLNIEIILYDGPFMPSSPADIPCHNIPLYAMPHAYVRPFHDGSPSLQINLKKTYKGNNDKSEYIASDMFTVVSDRISRVGFTCGFLSQKEQFGSISLNQSYNYLSVCCTCDGVKLPISSSSTSSSTNKLIKDMKTDWFCMHGVENIDQCEPLEVYMRMSGKYNHAKIWNNNNSNNNDNIKTTSTTSTVATSTNKNIKNKNKSSNTTTINTNSNTTTTTTNNGNDNNNDNDFGNIPPSGWCSWYHFFSNINENNLSNNLQQMNKIKLSNNLNFTKQGFNLFQIDDGYQTAWGDWLQLDKKKFPNLTLSNFIEKIIDENMIPGIWLAPFACDKHSFIASNHPNWILKKKGSTTKPSNSANCGKWFYGLDVTNPEVQEHIKTCISTLTKHYGFRYLKLDFLYAAILSDSQESFYDTSLTRAQAIQIGMEIVTAAAGSSIFLLGCGAPMGSVIGHVHANRVSADAGLTWLPEFPLPSYDKWNLPSAMNMIRNSICRMSMHGRWWINDPDCMLLRTSTSFTEDEIIGIATVKAMSGGSFILSDDLSSVPDHRMRIAQKLIPATNISAVAVDILDVEMPELLKLKLGQLGGGRNQQQQQKQQQQCDNNDNDGNNVGLWVQYASCNWSDSNKSNHISISTLFGNKTLQEIIQRNNENHNNEILILHIFDFWMEEYSYLTFEDSLSLLLPQFSSSPSLSTSSSPLSNSCNSSSTSSAQIVLASPVIASHSARLLSMRFMNDVLLPQYIGSNLHFSCGLEVKSFHTHQHTTNSGNNSRLQGDYENSNTDHHHHHSNPHRTKNENENDASTNTNTPSLHGCSIVFHEGSIRSFDWKGFVWMYLPTTTNVNQLRITGSVASQHGAGTASGGGDGGDSSQSAELVSIINLSSSSPTTVTATSTEAIGTGTGTGGAGAVYKIPVGRNMEFKSLGLSTNPEEELDLQISWTV
eukprot:gene10610-22149_t